MKYYVIKDCPGFQAGDVTESYEYAGNHVISGSRVDVAPPVYFAAGLPEYFQEYHEVTKSYRIKRAIPGFPVGGILCDHGTIRYGPNALEYSQFPDWFEEIE